MIFDSKRVLVTGATGSLGQAVVRRLLSGKNGNPSSITAFSRDETKQNEMRMSLLNVVTSTDEVIYRNPEEVLSFHIGDVRDLASIKSAITNIDVVVHAAALKQVPTCEQFPFEAVQTNIIGAQNLIRAVIESGGIESVVGISTDKACKPINVMGMTKAILERQLTEANCRAEGTSFFCVRYGNVLASRGSVVPLFIDQIRRGGPLTITVPEMTRFLLPIEGAVDTVVAALEAARPGEIYVPKMASATIEAVALALIGQRQMEMKSVGIRPGEKIHEILISEEESIRTVVHGDYHVVRPMLSSLLVDEEISPALSGEYSSESSIMSGDQLRELLRAHIQQLELLDQ